MRGRKSSVRPFVLGIGNNATDTIIRVSHFPALDAKVEILSADVYPGGQVATAVVACRRWGLPSRYVGKIGADAASKLQIREMKRECVEAHWIKARRCASQTAFILVDETTGERTVLWHRDAKIALRPSDLKRSWIRGSSALLVDGHDAKAATQAARWARAERIPVVGDFDNCHSGVKVLLEYVDFLIASRDFPERLTGEKDLLKSLPTIFRLFNCRLAAATLGRFGVLSWDGRRFLLCPGFRVRAVDTTGAGDIFHGAFLFGLVQDWPIEEILEFSCAAAALNCTAPGARGGIPSLNRIAALRRRGERSEHAYTAEDLRRAACTALAQGSHP
jgi:sulfofructose kinase